MQKQLKEINSSYRPLLKSCQVMERLGYEDGPAFWRFVKASGLPHIRLNCRRIMFDQQQVEDWLAHRTVGGREGAS